MQLIALGKLEPLFQPGKISVLDKLADRQAPICARYLFILQPN
jgi:hypothetical protein